MSTSQTSMLSLLSDEKAILLPSGDQVVAWTKVSPSVSTVSTPEASLVTATFWSPILPDPYDSIDPSGDH